MAVTRPGLGPTLPAVLRDRFGIPPVLTLAVAGVVSLAAVVAIVVTLTRPPAPGEQVVHEGPPVFNLLFPPVWMHEAKPAAGELLRLEGRKAGLRVSVAVRELKLPPFDGDARYGLLPVYADRFVEAEKRRMPGLRLVQEGRERINNAIGYEVAYARLTASERYTGRDGMLIPDDAEEGRGNVLLSLRIRKASGAKLTPPERGLASRARTAYRSFTFGTGRD